MQTLKRNKKATSRERLRFAYNLETLNNQSLRREAVKKKLNATSRERLKFCEKKAKRRSNLKTQTNP